MDEPPRGEFRRHATILFADLCDYTALNEVADPEEVDQILVSVRRTVEEVVRKHGGTVNEWLGDGALCTFGLPRATEDDTKHAFEAALEMHDAVRALRGKTPVPKGFNLCLHSGIDAGVIFARQRDGASSYQLIGDAVNTAARLCARADRDEIWAAETTLEGMKELFEVEAVELVALRGKKNPVRAQRIVARSGVTSRFAASKRRGLTPLIGRERALADLRRSLEHALEGRVEVIAIVGNPGVGKTRILEEFKRELGVALRIVTGTCQNEPDAAPVQPFVDMMRQLFELGPRSSRSELLEALTAGFQKLDPTLVKHAPALLRLLGLEAVPSESSNPELVQQSLVDALTDVFAASCARAPMVLVLDDWQWADDTSRQALGNIIRSLRTLPALLVIASRDLGDPLLAGHVVINLEPFNREQTARVVASLLPRALDIGLIGAIHERSGGNPLFLEELCRAMPAGVPSGEEDLQRSRVPSTLRGIIQVRAERLREEPARVLRAAAVIGNDIPIWLLEALGEVPNLGAALEELVEADLIHAASGGVSFRFKHGTTRDVVYESVRLPERRRLHDRAARALQAQAQAAALPEPYEGLAYHYAGAGDHELAARFAELAGDRAAASSSLDRARRHFRTALDALGRLGLEGELERRWIALVSKWASASLYSPAEEHLELIQAAGDRAMRLSDLRAAARAEYWLGWFHYALGNQEPAIRYYRAALEKLEKVDDPALRGQLFANLGQSLAAAGEYGEALGHIDTGLDIKRQLAKLGETKPSSARRTPLGFAYALGCKGLVHADLGAFEDAYRCFDEALGSIEHSGHAVEGSCLGLFGMVQLLRGHWEECLQTALKAQATAERVNGPYVFAMSKTVSGYARWILQRSSEALEELLHAVQWMEGRGIGLYLSFNYGYLAEALASAGETARAAHYANLAVARSTRTDRLGETMAYRTLALLAVRAGDSDATARTYFQKALQSARVRNSMRDVALTELAILKSSATLARASGDAAKLSELEQMFHDMGMHSYASETARLRD